jgi:hypothetical protein
MMRICKTKDTNVTVFTTKEIFSRIETYLDKKSNYEIVLKDDKESLGTFLKRVEKICNDKIDLLFVNTIQTNTFDLARYLRFKPKSKMILTVHTTNHWLKAKYAFNIKNLARTIDVNMSLFFIRKSILPKFVAINVIYAPTKDYILKNTNYKKPIFTLPFNFYEEKNKSSTKKKDQKIKVVIPGLVEDHRRDYENSLNLFEKLFEKFKSKLVLNILGKPVGNYGLKIIKRCEGLKNKGYNVEFSKEFVPEKTYDEVLANCDIIFSPLKVEKIGDTGIKEIYGKSEGSALPFEAIQYCKPLVVPKKFTVINELKSSTFQYDSEEKLEKILFNIMRNKDKVEKLKNEAAKNSQSFSLKVLQAYFTKEILNNLDSL